MLQEQQLPTHHQELLPTLDTPVLDGKEETKEISNPDGDKTIIILNFILREVLPLSDREKQKDLLVYFFRSILSETQKLPVTHLAYEIIQNKNGEVALHDDVYQLRPDLLQICKDAVASLEINQSERARYNLEKEQIEDLIKTLEEIFNLSPHAVLNLLANPENSEQKNNQTKESLESKGWITLPSKDSFTFIRPEVRKKMGIEGHQDEIVVGQKYLYVMPQSAIHEGNLSVFVMAQPVFIPSLNRFILLHDQHMAQKNWDEHENLFKKFSVDLPDNFSDLSFEEKEKLVMKIQIKLPEKLQTQKAEDTFLEIFPEQKFFKRLRQKLTRKKIEKMEPALNEYSELLLDFMNDELNNDPDLNPSTVNKLGNFLKRVVLAGVLDVKKISKNKRKSIFSHLKKIGDLGEKEFAISVAQNTGFTSSLKAFDTSLLECVALSPISSVQQLSKLQMKGLSPESLSKMDLQKFVGDRASDWKMGSCLKCGVLDTWIGECSWCLNCEMSYNSPIKNIPKPSKPVFDIPQTKQKIRPPTLNTNPESLGSFVATLI